MQAEALPYVDEHAVDVDAAADDVWRALLATVGGLVSNPLAEGYGRLVGCDPATASGPRPLTEGSTIPGFGVTRAVPEQELVLQGRHRFSTYALLFRIEQPAPQRLRLVAQTRAVFPGAQGAVYRTLVLRTGAHVVGVRRILSSVRRAAVAAA